MITTRLLQVIAEYSPDLESGAIVLVEKKRYRLLSLKTPSHKAPKGIPDFRELRFVATRVGAFARGPTARDRPLAEARGRRRSPRARWPARSRLRRPLARRHQPG